MSKVILSEDEKAYLEGMEIFRTYGVRILIDGIEQPKREWKNMFMLADRKNDGMTWCYMPDYIVDSNGLIREIRYIKVYNKGL